MNEIATPRLSLTLVTPDDHEFIYRLVNSKDWITFIGDRKVDSLETSRRYIEKIRATENFYYWVSREKLSGAAVGIVSFLKRDYLPDYDIGFALLPEYYSHGYALEATSAVLQHYRRNGHHTILATVLPSNTRSIRLLEKMGFAFEREVEQNGENLRIFQHTERDM